MPSEAGSESCLTEVRNFDLPNTSLTYFPSCALQMAEEGPVEIIGDDGSIDIKKNSLKVMIRLVCV